MIVHYFRKHLIYLMAVGIDLFPVQNLMLAIIYRMYSIAFLSVMYTYTVLEAVDVLNSKDLNTMTFGISYAMTHILGAVKSVMLIIKKKTLQEMLLAIEHGYFAPNKARGGDNEFSLIQATIKRINWHNTAFMVIVYCIVSSRGLYAFYDVGFDEECYEESINTTIYKHIRTLPYKAWSPVDLNKSPAYEIMFFLQISCLTCYGFYISCTDSMIYGMIIHMNTQYIILKSILDNCILTAKSIVLKKNPNISIEDKSYERIALPNGFERSTVFTDNMKEEIEHIINYCAKYHLEIINYCDKIESEFSYLMLMQFLSSLYTLCFQLYQLSLMENPLSFDFISMCFYLLLMMYQIFCYCWYGNEIMIQSAKFSVDLYNTQWMFTNERTKKSLLIMMMRAQRPISLTAGKFALLSLPTYVTIVRGSASYFMVLRQMGGSTQNNQ